MELWIRSQDKTTLIRSYEIYISEQSNTYLIRAKSTSHILGSYSTVERALEVLDEIQNKINLINLGHDFGSPMIDLKNPTYIYQMPKE